MCHPSVAENMENISVLRCGQLFRHLLVTGNLLNQMVGEWTDYFACKTLSLESPKGTHITGCLVQHLGLSVTDLGHANLVNLRRGIRDNKLFVNDVGLSSRSPGVVHDDEVVRSAFCRVSRRGEGMAITRRVISQACVKYALIFNQIARHPT